MEYRYGNKCENILIAAHCCFKTIHLFTKNKFGKKKCSPIVDPGRLPEWWAVQRTYPGVKYIF